MNELRDIVVEQIVDADGRLIVRRPRESPGAAEWNGDGMTACTHRRVYWHIVDGVWRCTGCGVEFGPIAEQTTMVDDIIVERNRLLDDVAALRVERDALRESLRMHDDMLTLVRQQLVDTRRSLACFIGPSEVQL